MAKSLRADISNKIEHLLNYQGCGDIELIFGILNLLASDDAVDQHIGAIYQQKESGNE